MRQRLPAPSFPERKENFSSETGKDALKITELQLEGKKRMDTAAFLTRLHD